jgi:uncharacterized alkaline shock family protein YloU
MVEHKNDSGSVKISDEAIATIAAITAKAVNGVVGLDRGAVQSIADMLGVKNETKGIKVSVDKEVVNIEMNIVVEYGREISEVASAVQERVRESIENMTGLIVDRVNINVNSVKMYTPGAGAMED